MENTFCDENDTSLRLYPIVYDENNGDILHHCRNLPRATGLPGQKRVPAVPRFSMRVRACVILHSEAHTHATLSDRQAACTGDPTEVTPPTRQLPSSDLS